MDKTEESYHIELLRKYVSFKGQQCYYRDLAEPLDRYIELAIYLPEAVLEDKYCSVLYYIPDLGSTAHKAASQSNYQDYANRYDMIVVIPDLFGDYQGDTQERLLRYDQEREAIHQYITEYLPKVIEHHFRAYEVRSIMGVGFGGTIALNLAWHYPDKFRGVSAFSPWVGFMNTLWFNELFPDRQPSAEIDPLLKLQELGEENFLPLWIDIGSEDQLIGKQIHLESLEKAILNHPAQQKIIFNQRQGYDHSYYFVASHICEHFVFHAEYHDQE